MSKTDWTKSQLFFSGDDFFNQLIKSIDAADKRIWIEVYIFDYDQLGHRVIRHLAKAYERGIDVRVLVDGIGSYNSLTPLKKSFEELKIPFKVFHPVRFFRMLILGKLWKINKRTHRKIFVTDDDVFIGSFNITQTHCESLVFKKAWRDTGVLVSGSALHEIVQSMDIVWSSAKGFFLNRMKIKKAKRSGYQLVRMNMNFRERFRMSRELKQKIRTAQSRVLLTNAYFLPRRSLLRAIIFAAKKGVQVGLCLPRKTDVKILQMASRGLFRELLKSGVHIYEYLPSVLHAKTIVVDNWAAIGSHNWNHRSLNHDLEIEIVLKSEERITELIDQWKTDIGKSEEVTFAQLNKMNLFEKFFGKFVFWFRYWL
jgi:cardiolipin synthase